MSFEPPRPAIEAADLTARAASRRRFLGGLASLSALSLAAPAGDVASTLLRDAARELRRGGVGYYRASDFVHVDTGRVRAW
jgi:hypothetical protein